MAVAVIMPRQGQSVESCILTQWHKAVGDVVRAGELLFTYETDKATFEEAAKADGTLLARFFEEDDDVPCLVNVAVIGAPGEETASFAPGGASAPAQNAPASTKKAPASTEKAPASTEKAPASVQAFMPAGVEAGRDVYASPRAKATAARTGVDIRALQPTGPYGRIIERDVFAALEAAEAPQQAAPVFAPEKEDAPAYEEMKQSNIRKTIARSMQASLQNSAQLTNHSTFDASAILALRRQFKGAPEALGVSIITLNDLVMFAVSRVLERHQDLNAHFVDGVLRRYRPVHLGMAVDTPRGLLVPTIKNANSLSLIEIAKQSKQLAADAQKGSINPDLLTGATFTISNLGALGVEQFTPVINPPQTGILGVCAVVERVKARDKSIDVYPAMGLSLTYDHRVVDGAPAARFVQDLAATLENIACLLAG